MSSENQAIARRRLRAAIVLGSALWIAAAVVLMPWGRVLGGPVARLALKTGVRVVFDTLELGWGSVTLHGVRFGLDDATGIDGTAKSVRIAWKPTRIDADDVRIQFSGSPIDSVLELARWAGNHARAFSVTISAKNVDVGGLDVPTGDLVGTAAGGSFVARERPGRSPFVASWTRGADGIEFVVGPQAMPRFQMEVSFASKRTVLTIAPSALRELALDLGLAAKSETISISGRAILQPPANNRAPVLAHVEGRIEGWSLGPPIELEGMSFGNVATFRTDVEMPRTTQQLTLRHGHLLFGDTRFDGDGAILGVRGLYLRGEIPCQAIAHAARSPSAGPVFTAILNRPFANLRTRGWLPTTVGFENDRSDTHVDASRRISWQVGSDCGIVPFARLDQDLEKVLLPRVNWPGALAGMCWVLPLGRDYPGFTFSDNACPPRDVPERGASAASPAVEITPNENRGYIGEIVSFAAALRRPSDGDWAVSCAGPARLDPPGVRLRPDEQHRIEAVVEPWRPAPDGGLIFSGGSDRRGPHVQRTLPIVPRDYEQLAPVWVEQEREDVTGVPELTASLEADDAVVRYQPKDAVDLSVAVRAMLVRSNGTNLLYASASLQPPGEEHHREPGTPTFRLAFPAGVARPVQVLIVEHHERACAFRMLELTVR